MRGEAGRLDDRGDEGGVRSGEADRRAAGVAPVVAPEKARVGDGGFIEEVRFGPNVEKEITLVHPKAVFRDENAGYAEYAVYELTVETTSGVRPAALGKSHDRRYLGVFVQPLLPDRPGPGRGAEAGRDAR